MYNLFSNRYESYIENNFYSNSYENISFDNTSLTRPIDFVIDTLVICADVTSIDSYLTYTQSLEPNEFVFSITFLDHIGLSMNEWSLYYELDLDEELGFSRVIYNFDASLLGFLSFSNEFFYFDSIDFFLVPDSVKLYDPYAGIVLSVIDEELALEDDLMEYESEDEDFHYELDDEHS